MYSSLLHISVRLMISLADDRNISSSFCWPVFIRLRYRNGTSIIIVYSTAINITAQLTEPYKSKLIGAFLDGTLTDLFHPVAKKEKKTKNSRRNLLLLYTPMNAPATVANKYKSIAGIDTHSTASWQLKNVAAKNSSQKETERLFSSGSRN